MKAMKLSTLFVAIASTSAVAISSPAFAGEGFYQGQEQGQNQHQQSNVDVGTGHGNFSPSSSSSSGSQSKSQAGASSSSGFYGDVNAGGNTTSVGNQNKNNNTIGIEGAKNQNGNNNQNSNGNTIGVDASSGGNKIQNGNTVDTNSVNNISVDNSTGKFDGRSDGRSHSQNNGVYGTPGQTGLNMKDFCGNDDFMLFVSPKRSSTGFNFSLFGGFGAGFNHSSERDGRQRKALLASQQVSLSMKTVQKALMMSSPTLAKSYIQMSQYNTYMAMGHSKSEAATLSKQIAETVMSDFQGKNWNQVIQQNIAHKNAMCGNGTVFAQPAPAPTPVQQRVVIQQPQTVVTPPSRPQPPKQVVTPPTRKVRVGTPKPNNTF